MTTLVEFLTQASERTETLTVAGREIRLRAPPDEKYQVMALARPAPDELAGIVRAIRDCLDTDEDLSDEAIRTLIRISGGVMGELVQTTLSFYGVDHLVEDASADPLPG